MFLFYTVSLFFSNFCFSSESPSLEHVKDTTYMKIYVNPKQIECLRSGICVKTTNAYFMTRSIFSDEKGTYLRAEIVDSYWECPACGRFNADSSDKCSNPWCSLSK